MLQKPLGGAWIEVAQAFPVEGVACVVIEMKVSARDGGGDFFAHPAGGEGVVFTTDDEGGTFDVFQLADGVVSDGSRALGLHGMDGLRCCIGGGVFETLLHVVPAIIVIEPRLREDQHLYVVHEVFRTHGGLALHEVLPGVETEAVLTSPSTHEDHAFHLLRVTQGELLSNDRAEGAADDTRLLDAKLIHQASVVISHHGGGVGAFRFVRLADAAVVAEDAAEVLGPFSGVGFPDAAWGSDAHDADQRFAAAAFFVKHLDSVGGDVWHGGFRG